MKSKPSTCYVDLVKGCMVGFTRYEYNLNLKRKSHLSPFFPGPPGRSVGTHQQVHTLCDRHANALNPLTPLNFGGASKSCLCETPVMGKGFEHFDFIIFIKTNNSTYGHRLLKTRLPVRSAKDKPQIGLLVVGSVTTSEY